MGCVIQARWSLEISPDIRIETFEFGSELKRYFKLHAPQSLRQYKTDFLLQFIIRDVLSFSAPGREVVLSVVAD
jgi:hypothetical protein